MKGNSHALSLLAASCAMFVSTSALADFDRLFDFDRDRGKKVDCSKKNDSDDLRVLGLSSDGVLVCFEADKPRRTTTIGTITGLSGADTALIGVDFRVQDGLLYGVGNGGGVYTISTKDATATLVNVLTVALEGASFGVDFNPAADRLRIISDTGQNLRHNVNAGGVTLVDGVLNYTAGTAALGVVGAAYTNNDLNAATATTLFDLDTTLDQIALQVPPNAGSLSATGKLNVDAAAVAGFDIFTTLDETGAAAGNRGFGVLQVAGVTGFYRINTLTGAAKLLSALDKPLVDIALPLN
jgi:hypothetical protein